MRSGLWISLTGVCVLLGCPGAGDDDDDPCGIDPLTVGIYHRETAGACPAEREVSTPEPDECGQFLDSTCSAHADCTDGPNGRCWQGPWGMSACECSYDECFSDAECEPDMLCACGEQQPFENYANHRCIHTPCHTDADCDAGYCMAVPYYCDLPPDAETLWTHEFACATDGDECRNHETCICEDEYSRCHPVERGGPWTCARGYTWDCD